MKRTPAPPSSLRAEILAQAAVLTDGARDEEYAPPHA